MNRSYSNLIRLASFEERYDYLKLSGLIGESSFGFDRFLNQALYTSKEWKSVRDRVIIRDDGCDLGHPDYPINGRVIIHHINLLTPEDLEEGNPEIFNLENLICVSLRTHNAIHFGDKSLLSKPPIERRQGDTCPWK